jgi:hypothetical protein
MLLFWLQFIEQAATAAAAAQARAAAPPCPPVALTPPFQIVCVGAGMDSSFFALHAELPLDLAQRLRYFEVDFKEVRAQGVRRVLLWG